MTPEYDPGILQEIRDVVRGMVATSVDQKLTDVKRDIDRQIKERTARPPGALIGAPEAGPALCRRTAAPLGDNASFRAWLTSPRSQHSSIAVELELKAATPISGVGQMQPYPALAGPPQPALRVAELIGHIVGIGGGGVEWTKETVFTPGAAEVPETTTKPATALTFQNITTPFTTTATITKASVQSLADVPALMGWINARLMYAVLLRQENYLLNDGTAGLLAAAQALAPAYTPGAGATTLDLIGSAISQLQSAGYSVDGVVMNGVDVNKTRLLKTTQNEYLWSAPDSDIGVAAMWNTPLVISPAMPAGQFLVGAFGQGALLFDRDVLHVDISYENEDDFVKNLACLRAELRAALAVPLPAAFVKGAVAATLEANHSKK